jgi:formiminotetrahydrofolate cyclodeaminase
VRINLGQLKDEKFKTDLANKVQEISESSDRQFKKVSEIVESKLG